MVRIGGGWNTLDNYLARCDPCRCHKSSATTAMSSTSVTSTCSQSPTSDSEAVSERQRPSPAGEPLNVCCSDLPSSSASDVTMTTVTTSGHRQQLQQQQPTVRRVNDLSPRSKPLPDSSRATATNNENGLTRKTNDVKRDSAATDHDFDVTCPDSVQSSSDRVVLTSSSSSPSLSAAAAGTPMPPGVSCSCTRLMSGDEVRRSSIARRRTYSCRPSRIPVPVRVAAQCRSHGASLLRTGLAINSLMDPYNRCDSGLDLNLSPPNFD